MLFQMFGDCLSIGWEFGFKSMEIWGEVRGVLLKVITLEDNTIQ
jgi:hypothetical protein